MFLHFARCDTKAYVRTFEDQLLRMAMGKAANQIFQPGVHSGKLTAEKVQTITESWVRYVSRSLPGVDVVQKANFVFVEGGGASSVKPEEAANEHSQVCVFMCQLALLQICVLIHIARTVLHVFFPFAIACTFD